MESNGPMKAKQKKKNKVSSFVKNKSSVEDVVLQMLPTLKSAESTGFPIAEEEIRKRELEPVKDKCEKQKQENGRSAFFLTF
jgi:hypothetical protein